MMSIRSLADFNGSSLGGDSDWLTPPPSPPRPQTPGRHGERGIGTSNWPPAETFTWPHTGTFSWPRTSSATSSPLNCRSATPSPPQSPRIRDAMPRGQISPTARVTTPGGISALPARGPAVLVGKPASPKRRVLDLFIRLNAYAGAAWAFDMYQVAIGVVSETRGPEVTSCRLRDK